MIAPTCCPTHTALGAGGSRCGCHASSRPIDERRAGYAGNHLRLVSDFQTTDRFHVASHDGAGVGPTDHDQWLTCFKDPLGHSDVGEHNTVFAHGEDGEGDRKFQRIAGKDFERNPSQLVARPSLAMEAVRADSSVLIRPVQRRNYMAVEVDSLLEVRAVGGTMQHVALAMPTERSDRKDYQILAVETEDGRPLARVGPCGHGILCARGRRSYG